MLFHFFSHLPFVWAFLGYVQDLQLFQAAELGFQLLPEASKEWSHFILTKNLSEYF